MQNLFWRIEMKCHKCRRRKVTLPEGYCLKESELVFCEKCFDDLKEIQMAEEIIWNQRWGLK